MAGSGASIRSVVAEPAGSEVHQVFDEAAVERLPVGRLTAVLTAHSANAL
jgi:hypothetical protein